VSAVLPSLPATAGRFGALPQRQFVALVTGFWICVGLSAVLYAYGMDVTIRQEHGVSLFVNWQTRVVQYLLLFPVLLCCYALSLRAGWSPRLTRWPLQLFIGASFAVLARPALWLAMALMGHEDKAAEEALCVTCWIGSELPLWLASFSEFMVRYGFGLALVHGLTLYKSYHDSELKVAALEQQWSAARLAALRMQLSPHTLFNLLHTIRGQIAWDPQAAQAMVVQLADLLRKLLNAGAREFTTLADELAFQRLYLELQSRRFSDRLGFALPAAWVPSLILQPLVENAVVHGLAGATAAVRVEVTAAVHGSDRDRRLVLAVTNDMAPGRAVGAEGVGLRNVRERLDVLFGTAARFTTTISGDRWIASIDMPALESPP
jgi:hypothetical protein